jgi:hypothetical protein
MLDSCGLLDSSGLLDKVAFCLIVFFPVNLRYVSA